MRKKKILYVFNASWFFISHRIHLARVAQDNGYDVHVAAAPYFDGIKKIEGEGMIFHPIPFSRKGINPFSEIKIVWMLFKLYKSLAPDIIEHATIKPVIYGGIARSFSRNIPVVNWMTGLGYVFINNSARGVILRKIVSRIYALIFRNINQKVIFENSDDLNYFVKENIISIDKTILIQGAGVDTSQFMPSNEPQGLLTVSLPARMLWDKGVGDFVEAAKLFKATADKSVRFVLVGDSDEGNPAAVPVSVLEDWKSSGIVEWLGHESNMPKVFSESHVVCLPSYREGLPKALLEAASCGRAIVTYDVPGCREVVKNGINGYLVPLKNIEGLVSAFKKLLYNQNLRKSMGDEGRRMVLESFTQEKIARETMEVYTKLIS